MLALRHLDQYAGRSTYIRWMSTITMREAITQIRRSKNVRWDSGSEGLEFLPADVRTPEQLAISQELAEILDAAQRLLPLKYWMVFRLRGVESLSESETAVRLGVTRACVRIRLFRAKVLLRGVLSNLHSDYPNAHSDVLLSTVCGWGVDNPAANPGPGAEYVPDCRCSSRALFRIRPTFASRWSPTWIRRSATSGQWTCRARTSCLRMPERCCT
jgi:RNA polymerase sigma-70 factor (ECF subfamily)